MNDDYAGPGRHSAAAAEYGHPHEDASNYFNDAAATWDDDPQVARAEAIAAEIVSRIDIPANAKGLDVGCGTGLGSWPLADHFEHITLADPSEGMLQVARERIAAREDSEKFSVLQMDLAKDRLPADSYDVIYSVMALHHVPDLDFALENLTQALRPGGWLAIAELNPDPTNSYHHNHPEAHAAHHGFDPAELGRQLKHVGFTNIASSNVYQITKQVEDVEQSFDIFLLTASRS